MLLLPRSKVDIDALVPQRVTFTVQFDLVLSCKLYSTASVCFDAPAASGSARFFLLLRNDPKDLPQVACTRRSYRFFLNRILSFSSSSLSSLSFFFFVLFLVQRATGNRYSSKRRKILFRSKRHKFVLFRTIR